MSDFIECSVVVLTCGDVRKIPVGEVVERGYSNGFCTVLFASPPKCIITNATKIRYGSKCEYSEESLTNNILITERCNGSRKVYAYPKKVYELLKSFIFFLLLREDLHILTVFSLLVRQGLARLL